ncbi:major facilitator superfamily domain-containing protein [Xylariaceae sp. FL0594]|nr:major facilitator superfamily domain-containing protein [Xylariaceae sp. FL0594]
MEAPAWGKGAKRPLSGLSRLRTASQVHFKEELRPALDYKFPTFYSPDKYPLVDLASLDSPSSRPDTASRFTVGSVPSSRPILSSRFSSDWTGIHEPAPDGGIKAWSVVVGGFLTYFATFGLLNSFGTFQTYYQDTLLKGSGSSTISWIGSVQLFLLFIGGLFVGPAFDKFGAFKVTAPGAFFYVLSFMFTSLSTKFYQILLSQGFLYGIADAMLFYPTISAVNVWFDHKRGLALGIVVSGSSVGGIVWPILIERLIASIGFPWALRATGFICLAVLIPSVLLVKERKVQEKSNNNGKNTVSDGKGANNASNNSAFDTQRLKVEILTKEYMLQTAGFTFAYLGLFIPFYYLSLFAIKHGVEPGFANYLLAILNAGSFVGRIVSGFFADKFGPFNITFVSSSIAGIVLLSLLAITTQPQIIAFSVLYGLFSGGLISLQSACIAQISPNKAIIGVKIGIMMAVCSVGVLIGNPIAGILLDRAGGEFTTVIIFAGVTLSFGSFLFLLSRLVVKTKSKVF